MKKHFSTFALLLLAGTPLFSQVAPDRNRPTFYFGEQKISIGMSEREALKALSSCCKLSPPAEPDHDTIPSPEGGIDGHFILSKDPTPTVLGGIYFSQGKVVRLSRDLAPDVDAYNEDLVAFIRAFKRALPEGSNSAVLTLRHESLINGESDTLALVFPNGHGVELRIGLLDPSKATNKRDFVSLDETLQPSR